MNETKPKICKQNKKILCDWTDEKNCLILYRMLIFYIRHGVIVDKTHEMNFFNKVSGWKKI